MSLLDLPEDVWRNVASNLATPDLLQFLSSHRRFHEQLGQSSEFWKFLLGKETVHGDPRQEYMIQSYMNYLPAVQWIHLQNNPVSKREGHLSCVFSTRREDLVCMTGGFTHDPYIYLMRVDHASSQWEWVRPRIRPEGPHSNVYGATLTAVDEFRAVRVGGFQAGGYSHETNQVVLLERTEGPESSHRFRWQILAPQNPECCTPRAYHTATLIGGRYIVIIGGMTSSGCIIRVSILDTSTWTWLPSVRITNVPILTVSEPGREPSGRHGHSVILDAPRNRLVLFGGGNGSDLLHSGQDNSEVWELQMGAGWETNLEGSFPWKWRPIHHDSNQDESDSDMGRERRRSSQSAAAVLGPCGESIPSAAEAPCRVRDNVLSPAESLCLGRCHAGVRVSPDMALLMCGSGRPSTNRVIAYNLAKDSFLRPKALGSLPIPRFTFVTEFIERHGYILIHGGYSSQEEDAIGDMVVLDLAPLVQNRDFATQHHDHVTIPPCYGPVLDSDARNGRMSSQIFFRQLFDSSLVNDQQRQELASEFVEFLISSGQYGGRFFTRLNMVAEGSVFVAARNDEDEDDTDESYHQDDDDDDDEQNGEDEDEDEHEDDDNDADDSDHQGGDEQDDNGDDDLDFLDDSDHSMGDESADSPDF